METFCGARMKTGAIRATAAGFYAVAVFFVAAYSTESC